MSDEEWAEVVSIMDKIKAKQEADTMREIQRLLQLREPEDE